MKACHTCTRQMKTHHTTWLVCASTGNVHLCYLLRGIFNDAVLTTDVKKLRYRIMASRNAGRSDKNPIQHFALLKIQRYVNSRIRINNSMHYESNLIQNYLHLRTSAVETVKDAHYYQLSLTQACTRMQYDTDGNCRK
jgi:hypothetical protein